MSQRDRLAEMLANAMWGDKAIVDGSGWLNAADALLARGVRVVDVETTEGEFCQWSCPACGTDVTSIVRSRRVVDEGERVISAATAEALRDVVRAYLANDEKGLLGACADLSAGMEVER